MAWLLLAGAIATEVMATAALKISDGLTKLAPSIVVGIGYVASFVLLAWALKLQLQVSVAYAISSKTKYPNVAAAFLDYMSSPEAAQLQFTGGFMPVDTKAQ